MQKNRKIDEAIKTAFRQGRFVAIYLAGPADLVPRKMGDNYGARPVKIGHTSSYKDSISDVLDGASPFWEQRMFLRVWVSGKENAKTLEGHLRGRWEGFSAISKLRKSWIDMGPDFDETLCELEIRGAAAVLGIKCWSDHELTLHLGEIVHAKMKRRAERMRA